MEKDNLRQVNYRHLKLEFLSEAPHREPFRVINHQKKWCCLTGNKQTSKGESHSTDNCSKMDFFSSVLLRVKKDGSYRMILNLKKLNKFIDSKYFKVESLQNALHKVKSGIYMASVDDLKDSYYSVSIYEKCQKYLKFLWEYSLKFIAMLNVYGPAMIAFTKLVKHSFPFLRSEGCLSVIYVNDCYLQGDLFTKCPENVMKTIEIPETLHT